MRNDNESLNIDSGVKPIWNLYQFGLAVFCFISVSVLYKIPIDHYFGSGWTSISIIIFILILASPIIYLQLRFGSTYQTGILGIMDRFLPLGLIFTIGCFLRNFIHVIYVSGLITHCLTYIFFSMFNCDGKLCIGGVYPWSTCNDAWAGGDCLEGVQLIIGTPTAEEKFYQNFILMQTTQITTSEGFPDWFQYIGLIIVPHLLTWIILFLLIIGGARFFGKILYGLIPVAVILYLTVFIYVIAKYSNDIMSRSQFLNDFYTRLPNHVPVIATVWDQFAFEPLIWGFLSTFAHLSIGLNLWNGVYPIMGKWIGNGKKQTHLSWIIVPLVFGSFVAIPTLLNVSFLASSFSKLYLRCQISRSWSFPFTVAAHVFTKFATNKALTVAYYVANLCFLLASEGLLLVVSLDTIIDHMKQWHSTIAKNVMKSYRIACVLVVILLCGLSFSTIIKSGYYWIYLMDFYVDRLLCFAMIGQSICLIVIYAFSKPARFEGKLLKIFFVIYLCIICILLAGVLVWYSVDAGSTQPTKDCYYAKLDPRIDPIPVSYIGLGWLIAASPFLVGLIVGSILIFLHSRKRGVGGECHLYLLRGDKVVAINAADDGEEERMIEMTRGGDTRNLTSLGRMQYMKDTLQSGPWQQSTLQKSLGESSTPSNVYANEPPNILYDQRQSIRRPLISPESSEVSGLDYAQIKKTRRKPRPIQEEFDI